MEASKQSDAVLRRPARCENALRTSAPIHNKGCHNVSMIESISEYVEAPVPSSPRRNPCSTSRGSNNEITIPQRWENSRDVNDDTEHSPNVCEAQEYVYNFRNLFRYEVGDHVQTITSVQGEAWSLPRSQSIQGR
jgi:hypothetical protein